MEKPLVSIVSPIYGVENYIEECLVSMFEQTYQNIEYVFVNDMTPDKSMTILNDTIKRFDIKNVKIINHERNLGLCGVRNTGLKAAKGDYILIVDSDDVLPLNAVEILVSCAIANNSDFVESDFAFYYGEIGNRYKRFYSENKSEYIAAFLSMKTAVSIWGKLYKRELFGNIDDLFVIGRDNVEDYYSTPILADRAKKIAYTNEVTYYYRIDNPSSYSRTKYVSWNKIDDMIYCSKRHNDYFGTRDDQMIQEALKEQKYKIKSVYFPRLSSSSDRKALMKLFPENEDYVKKKPFMTRLFWFYMKHDLRRLGRITELISGILKKLWMILKK